MTKTVVILTNFRSGSHFLHALFVENGYNPQGEIIPRLVSQIRQFNRAAFQQARKATLQAKLPAMFQTAIPEGSICIAHYQQIKNITDVVDAAALRSVFGENVVFVHLDRDPLDCAVSWFIANQDRQYFSFQQKRNDVEYHFDRLKKHYENYLRWKWDDALVAEVGAVSVTYEELVSDTPATLHRIATELGLEPFTKFTQEKFKKQSNTLKAEFKRKFAEDLQNQPIAPNQRKFI